MTKNSNIEKMNRRIDKLDKLGFVVRFVSHHPFVTGDRFPVEGYLCLITMGTDNKVMFFRNNNTGAQFGVGLFHRSHVSLSAFGAGVRGSASDGGDSPVSHCVMTVGNEQSWLLGNEYKFSF